MEGLNSVSLQWSSYFNTDVQHNKCILLNRNKNHDNKFQIQFAIINYEIFHFDDIFDD